MANYFSFPRRQCEFFLNFARFEGIFAFFKSIVHAAASEDDYEGCNRVNPWSFLASAQPCAFRNANHPQLTSATKTHLPI